MLIIDTIHIPRRDDKLIILYQYISPESFKVFYLND